jgi:hypothetical protein
MQYGVFYMHRREQSGRQEVCKTYHIVYKTVYPRMNLRGSKHVGDTRNYKLNINFRKLCISLVGVL